MVTENIERPSQKNVWGYQSKMKDPIAKNTKENNTMKNNIKRLIYIIIYTYTVYKIKIVKIMKSKKNLKKIKNVMKIIL